MGTKYYNKALKLLIVRQYKIASARRKIRLFEQFMERSTRENRLKMTAKSFISWLASLNGVRDDEFRQTPAQHRSRRCSPEHARK
jgi:hypothetical protein